MQHLEAITNRFTYWVGTPSSIIIHTLIFAGVFCLRFFGVGIDEILLVLTTAVSLEAIYLAIFIQMSVNRTSQSLSNVEKDIDDIQEDVEDLGEDVDDIQEDVKEITEDTDDEGQIDQSLVFLQRIESQVISIQKDLEHLKQQKTA